MDKISDKLAALLESDALHSEVNLHVMLKRDLEGDRTRALIQQLEELATDKRVRLFPLANIVTLKGRLDSIKQIAGNPDVVWIDQDTEAPMEELLDE